MPFQNNLKKYVGKASYSFEYSSLFYHNSYCKKYESVIQWYTQALCKTKKGRQHLQYAYRFAQR